MFVGVGDLAGYVRQRVTEALSDIDTHASVSVVAPELAEGWEASQWSSLLPMLPENRRISRTADEFLDLLAGAYVCLFFQSLRDAVQDQAQDVVEGVDRLLKFLEQLDSLVALRWFRSTVIGPKAGQRVTGDQNLAKALTALGLLCYSSGPQTLRNDGGTALGDGLYYLIVAVSIASASQVRREAERRLHAYLSAQGPGAQTPTFIAAGHVGNLTALSDVKGSVIGPTDPQSTVDGPLAIAPRILSAEQVLGA